MAVLDAAQVRWHQAYATSNLLGIKADIKARLGMTVRSIEMLAPDPDMRVLVRQEFEVLANSLVGQKRL